MRDIKFRAWEKKLKEIIPVKNIDFEAKMINKDSIWRKFDEIQLMQYTGLKDKNDKEIYEGDIVEITWAYDKSIHKFKVYYDSENAYYSLKEIGRDDLDVLCGYSKEQIEIIGNIYENPNLLKETCQ